MCVTLSAIGTTSFSQLSIPGLFGVCRRLPLPSFVSFHRSVRSIKNRTRPAMTAPFHVPGDKTMNNEPLPSSRGSASLCLLLLSKFTVNCVCVPLFSLTFTPSMKAFTVVVVVVVVFSLFRLRDSLAAALRVPPPCRPPPGHGYCSCGRCICEDGWFGKLCQFQRSCDMSDVQSKELCETSDGVLCSGKGQREAFHC